MKHHYCLLLILTLLFTGHSAFADTGRKMVVEDGRMVVKTENKNNEPVDRWMPDAPLNSLTFSYGAMGTLVGSYGTALDLTYYRQTDRHERQGVSFRWFHDFRHDNDHYFSYDWDGWKKNTQVESFSLNYQIQTFKRKGNWEYSIAGGFGIGYATIYGYNKRTKDEREVYLKKKSAENRDDDGSGALGKGLSNIIIFGLHEQEADIFLDASVTGAFEYYFNDQFSLGMNASMHYHTIIYLDLSVSAQIKVLF